MGIPQQMKLYLKNWWWSRWIHESAWIGITYTYSEPMIWDESGYDTAKRAHQEGPKTGLVTNGFVQKEPLMELLPFIDAMNIGC